MAVKPWTVGFYGSGDVDAKLVGPMLDDELPSDAAAIIPDKIRRAQKGLNAVWSWLDEEKVSYEKVASGDIIETLLDLRDKEGDEVYLFIARDPEGRVDERMIIEEALDAEIPVRDLCRLLEPIDTLEAEPEEPPAEPEKPAPARRPRGRARGTTDTADEAQATTAVAVAAQSEPTEPSTIDMLAKYIVQLVKEEVARQVHPGVHAHGPNDPPEPAAKPAKASVKAFVDQDGNYRLPKKAGRPRRGETPVDLTPAQVAELGLEEE